MVERVHSTTVAVMPTSIFGLSFEAKALCEATPAESQGAYSARLLPSL